MEIEQDSSSTALMQVREAPSLDEAQSSNPLSLIHSLLRGHYLWALAFALLGALGGALLAWRAVPDEYRTAGLIRIRPYLSRVLYANEENGELRSFSSYVDFQVQRIRSERVTTLAMQSPEWQAISPSMSPDALSSFLANLLVTRPKSSEIIEVAYSDTDPRLPPIAVRAVIDAFLKVYDETEAASDAKKLETLEDRKTLKTNELKGINDRIYALASQFGSNALEQMHSFKVQELKDLQTQLRGVELALLAAEEQPEPATQPLEVSPPITSLNALAAEDGKLWQMIQRKREEERNLEQLTIKGGENHPEVIAAKALLKSLETDVQDYIAERAINPELQPHADWRTQQMPGVIVPLSPERLRAQQKHLQEQRRIVEEELRDLGEKNLQIQKLQREAGDVQEALGDTKRRIDELNVESPASSRLEVIDYGGRPTSPSAQKRPAWAGAGAVAGAMLGLAGVIIWGLFDRRVRDISDAWHAPSSGKRLRLLGAMPILPTEPVSVEQATSTAHAVHQIRARLQIYGASDHRAIAITSPSPGNGKTSITTALGMSFAASGTRTLLIDGDLLGAGLTTCLNARVHRKVIDLLRQNEMISQEQLDRAQQIARDQNRRVGKVLVEEGFISKADISQALELQRQSMVGLLDVIEGEPLASCVTATATSNLYVLPLGGATPSDVSQLSPAGIRRVLEQAKKGFDVTLIDTGPIMGSIEAAVITAEVDGVVLIGARGDQRALLTQAIEELESIGANLIGAIFNRALEQDLLSSGFSSRASARSSSDKMLLPTTNGNPRLGPIASAVISSRSVVPTANGNGNGH